MDLFFSDPEGRASVRPGGAFYEAARRSEAGLADGERYMLTAPSLGPGPYFFTYDGPGDRLVRLDPAEARPDPPPAELGAGGCFYAAAARSAGGLAEGVVYSIPDSRAGGLPFLFKYDGAVNRLVRMEAMEAQQEHEMDVMEQELLMQQQQQQQQYDQQSQVEREAKERKLAGYVEQLMAVTGCSADQARTCLDAADGDINIAAAML